MTFQPPQSGDPQNSPPSWSAPPPAYGQPAYAPRAGGIDVSSVHPLDWAGLAAGALALIFSFFSYYTASASGFGVTYSESVSAWHDLVGGGFFGWFGVILTFAAAVVLGLSLFAQTVRLAVAPRLLTLALFAGGLLFELLAIAVHPPFASGFGISVGHGFSFWICLLLAAAGTAVSFLRFQQTGGPFPGALRRLNAPPPGA